MSDYNEHLISMAGGDGEEPDAEAKVAEWARQWRLNQNIDKSGTIYNVWFDPAASAVELNLNDIEALLALVREQRMRIDFVQELVDSAERKADSEGRNAGCVSARGLRAALTAKDWA